MSEEIKEILDIERYRNKDGYVGNINLLPDEMAILFDYITNLQEENDKFYDETMKDIKDNLIARINRQDKELKRIVKTMVVFG